MITLAFLNSPTDWLIVGVIALLLFGTRRLPEFGRSLGKGIVEFKKGLKGLEDDIEGDVQPRRSEPIAELPRPPQRVTQPGPRFDNVETQRSPNADADRPPTHS